MRMVSAGLHPGRRANSLTIAEIDALRVSIEHVLTLAVKGRGSTIRDYIGGSGLKGEERVRRLRPHRRRMPECATIIEVQAHRRPFVALLSL